MSAATRIAATLGLAATPCFAALAMLTAISRAPAELCAAGGWSLVGGMAPMYALMALFHAGPWLRLIAVRLTP